MIKVEESEMGRAYSANGKKMITYRILVGKPDRKKPLGRPGSRWGDNIEMGLRCEGVVWTRLMWLRIGSRLL
jgi:hypothetical protein